MTGLFAILIVAVAVVAIIMNPTRVLATQTLILIRKWLYVLWLFTKSDVLTFVLPNTFFGILGALSGLLTDPTSSSPNLLTTLARLPHVIAFNWLNLLIFDIANQRLPAAIIEDTLNKPWRPLPSALISASEADTLLHLTIPIVLLASYILGVLPQSIILITLSWMNNDLGGGEEYWTRHTLLFAAFAVYNSASLKLAAGSSSSISEQGRNWIAIISTVIATTIQIQDLKDLAGDQQRGRRTMPLILGDEVTRWSIILALAFWSVLVLLFWRVGVCGFLMTAGLAAAITVRVLIWRDPDADCMSWKLWSWWTALLYALPLLRSLY